jgi:hypothetical protein
MTGRCFGGIIYVPRAGVPWRLLPAREAANTHDSQLLEPLVDAVPAVIGPRGPL